ncbi:hypothetical protein ACLOJK_027426 [Asimina triloba]
MIFSLGLRASSCIRVSAKGYAASPLRRLPIAGAAPPRLLARRPSPLCPPLLHRPCPPLLHRPCPPLLARFVIAGDAIIEFSIVAPDQSDSSSLSSVFPLRRRAILPLFLPPSPLSGEASSLLPPSSFLSPVRRVFLSPSCFHLPLSSLPFFIVFVAGASRITAAPDFRILLSSIILSANF